MLGKALTTAAAGNAAGEGLYVEDVFSTYLYTGTDPSNQTITNGIDLDGEGGLVWIKWRSGSLGISDHALYDTERGIYKYLESNQTGGEVSNTTHLRAFNSDGFDIGVNLQINSSGNDYASWTFRKAPKFFDVVTYTGDGNVSQTISHNLGSAPGFMLAKETSGTGSWFCYHRSLGATKYLELNSTGGGPFDQTYIWNDTEPTSTHFTVGNDQDINNNGSSYVAYLFAHNDGDGEFGESGDQDIIKCGSYTANSSGVSVDLGFEPQWVLVKVVDTAGSWYLIDNMRGGSANDDTGVTLKADGSDAENTANEVGYITATGFNIDAANYQTNEGTFNYIYIAIRRGPMKTPESGTEVFAQDYRHNATPAYTSNFPVDWAFQKRTTGTTTTVRTRMLGTKYLEADNTGAEQTLSTITWDYNDGMESHTSDQTDKWQWMFRRAPGFFDVVAYTGDFVAGRTVAHNLGVEPEMMIVKGRTFSDDWCVYHKEYGGTHYGRLQNNVSFSSQSNIWNDTDPTSTEFTLGAAFKTNASGEDFVAYLFASLPGVSKVGSYTGNGTSQTIDCGFSTGARFVMIKRTDSTGDWHVYDSERGIVAGNDPRLEINTTDAEDTGSDDIDPVSSGFSVTSNADVNTNTAEYIFLAIA